MIIYINEYGAQEQKAMESLGTLCYRVSGGIPDFSEITPGRYLVRSELMHPNDYGILFDAAKTKGVNFIQEPKSYLFGFDFSEQIKLLGSLNFKSTVSAKKSSPEDILRIISESSILTPIFLKANTGSAAKYSGIESCIIKDLTLIDVSLTLNALNKNIKEYDYLIIKEYQEIAKEFRLYAVGNNCIIENKSNVDAELAANLARYAKNVVSLISSPSITPAYFIDIGIKLDGAFVIVELKNILNGSIKDVSGFNIMINNFHHYTEPTVH